MSTTDSEVQHLLQSVHRFVSLIQHRHLACVQTNTLLRRQMVSIVHQFNAARTSAQSTLSTCSTTIHSLQAQVQQLQRQQVTTNPKPASTFTPTRPATRPIRPPRPSSPPLVFVSPEDKPLLEPHLEQSGEWVRHKTYRLMVLERNKLQQQLSATLSKYENLHAQEVLNGSEALQQSIRLTRQTFDSRQDQMQETMQRATAVERKLADNQKVQYEMSLQLSAYKQKCLQQEKKLEQIHRERSRLLHQCQENKQEIQLLKENLDFVEHQKDEMVLSTTAMDEQWKELLVSIEQRTKESNGMFNRADRFMMETKIQLLERELLIRTKGTQDEKGMQ